MANLFNNDIGLNYKGLINIGSTINQNISGSLQYLTDGDGNNLPLQINTTGLVLGNANAAVYINLNDSGINFFDAIETRYRNVAGTTLAMNVWGNLGRVAIGGSATTPYTPSVPLQVRGDAANPMARFEDNAGTLALQIQHSPAGIGLLTSGSWVAYNSSTTQLVGIQSGYYYILNSTVRFQINLATNETRNLGNLFLGSIAVATSARLHVRGDGTNPIARFENSAGVEFFSVSNTGVVNFATTGGSILLTPGSSPVLTLSTFFASVGGLQIQMNTSALSGAGTISKFVFTQAYALTGASATNVNELVINPSFTANANPGVFNGINLAPTINQTGGANGITRGVYVAPTLTSAADFRALDVLTGSTSGHKLIRLANAAGSKVFEVNAAQEIGLFGVTPIAQPTTGIAGATVAAGGGAAILEDDLFAGYTVAQIAQALVNLGILKP